MTIVFAIFVRFEVEKRKQLSCPMRTFDGQLKVRVLGVPVGSAFFLEWERIGQGSFLRGYTDAVRCRSHLFPVPISVHVLK